MIRRFWRRHRRPVTTAKPWQTADVSVVDPEGEILDALRITLSELRSGDDGQPCGDSVHLDTELASIEPEIAGPLVRQVIRQFGYRGISIPRDEFRTVRHVIQFVGHSRKSSDDLS